MATEELPGEAAVRRQVERDSLEEIIAAAQAQHGPVTDEEVATKRAVLASRGAQLS